MTFYIKNYNLKKKTIIFGTTFAFWYFYHFPLTYVMSHDALLCHVANNSISIQKHPFYQRSILWFSAHIIAQFLFCTFSACYEVFLESILLDLTHFQRKTQFSNSLLDFLTWNVILFTEGIHYWYKNRHFAKFSQFLLTFITIFIGAIEINIFPLKLIVKNRTILR